MGKSRRKDEQWEGESAEKLRQKNVKMEERGIGRGKGSRKCNEKGKMGKSRKKEKEEAAENVAKGKGKCVNEEEMKEEKAAENEMKGKENDGKSQGK